MCRYNLLLHRCAHTRKTPAPRTCTNTPTCVDAHAQLLELTRDLSTTRKAIRAHHTADTSNNGTTQLKTNYKSFFGHGSGNGSRVIDSLEQLEDYLDGEIKGVCTDTNPVVRSNTFCEDGCWESVQIQAREESERREREQDSADRETNRRAESRRWERAERGADFRDDGYREYGGPPPPYQR
ncbi:hypothetical protein N7G274_000640 [Stereocaulon virgatum]|uniref:Uncharacterized protein n=1 Tax=Stereocaulon virgatum TaxID=373712 RepID=A0ABR4AR27_9LECA